MIIFSVCFKCCIKSSKHEKKPLKGYRKLNLLWISIIGTKWIFHYTQKTGKNSNKTIRQLPLISYLYHTVLKKQDLHTNQNKILSGKIK